MRANLSNFSLGMFQIEIEINKQQVLISNTKEERVIPQSTAGDGSISSNEDLIRARIKSSDWIRGFSQLQFPFLLQRRPGDHFERVVRETSGCDGDRLSHGGSNIHVHTAVVLRSFLPLSLLRQYDFPALHVRHVRIQGRQDKIE